MTFSNDGGVWPTNIGDPKLVPSGQDWEPYLSLHSQTTLLLNQERH